MASGTAGLALKAAVVSALLAMLVLPSSGRCPSLGPAPPPPPAPTPSVPEPTTAPALAPAPRCQDCSATAAACESSCKASIPQKCSKPCNDPQGYCDECKAAAIGRCTANCGTGSCDCDGAAANSCSLQCSTGICSYCEYQQGRQCRYGCDYQCKATCVP